KHLAEFDNHLAPRVSSLQGTFKRLQDLSLSLKSGNTLVEDCSLVIKEVENTGHRCRAQVVGLQASVAERLSFARQVGIVDKGLASVESSLADTRSRSETILSSLNNLDTASLENIDTSLSEKLSLLHSDARSVLELLERATQPLLRTAEGSVQTLRAQRDGSPDSGFHDLCSQCDSRLQQAQAAYVECSTAATGLSTRIGEAEARESARLEAEIASQKQAEQERLRREQEEKERAVAAAAAEREAEIERKRQEAEDEMRRIAEETAKREEAERQARLAAELEAKRIADELARLKEAEDARRRADEEAALRRVAEEAERFAALQVAEQARLAAERAQHEAEAAARAAAEVAARDKAESAARVAELEAEAAARAAAEDAARDKAESAAREAELEAAVASSERVDVFGLQVTPGHKRTVSKEELDLKVVIASLRTRLRSLSLQSIIRPTTKAGTSSKSPAPTPLPTQKDADDLRDQYNEIVSSFAQLPARLQDASAQAELKSLQFEMEAAKGMMTRVLALAAFSSSSTTCDNALSDLLEHLDSYPAPPLETTAPHQSDPSLSPEGQLSDRVGFTGAQIDAMKEAARGLGDDERVAAERTRLQQTWTELWEMSMDKINGIPSRPPSSVHTPSETGSQRYINLNIEADFNPIGKQGSFSSLRRSRATSSLSNLAAAPSPTAASHPPHLGIGL
ncbi:hypothetical protein FRC00_012318, partial [Tulasnella sp. 408]